MRGLGQADCNAGTTSVTSTALNPEGVCAMPRHEINAPGTDYFAACKIFTLGFGGGFTGQSAAIFERRRKTGL